MEKRTFRIGELAEHLALECFVIRFWERAFNIKAQRSDRGQRSYTEQDLHKFLLIKELLYEKGFTIAGAKKLLQDLNDTQAKKLPSASIIASKVTTMETDTHSSVSSGSLQQQIPPNVSQQIVELQKRLLKLRELL